MEKQWIEAQEPVGQLHKFYIQVIVVLGGEKKGQEIIFEELRLKASPITVRHKFTHLRSLESLKKDKFGGKKNHVQAHHSRAKNQR